MIIIPGNKKNLAKRYYANFFDYSILFIAIFLFIFLTGDPDERGTYRVTGLATLVIPLAWILYFPICESVLGQTLGKKAFNLYIVDLSGDSPTAIQTFLRRILDPFEISALGIPALLFINYSEKNQRIGDMIAGTTVIKTDAVCRFCQTEIELTPKEVIRDSFICPTCKEVN